jgi:hypothetical protein
VQLSSASWGLAAGGVGLSSGVLSWQLGSSNISSTCNTKKRRNLYQKPIFCHFFQKYFVMLYKRKELNLISVHVQACASIKYRIFLLLMTCITTVTFAEARNPRFDAQIKLKIGCKISAYYSEHKSVVFSWFMTILFF